MDGAQPLSLQNHQAAELARLNVLEAYRVRDHLTPGEAALLELVGRLSVRQKCNMGNARLAAELGVNPRTVRKLKASLQAKGVLMVEHRRGPRAGRNGTGTNLMYVCAKPVADAFRGGPRGPGGEALEGLPRGGPPGPPKKIPLPTRADPGPGGRDGELFGRHPFHLSDANGPAFYEPGGNNAPADRLRRAFDRRMFTTLEWEGEPRLIAGLSARNGCAHFFLQHDRDPYAEPQRVTVENTKLGSLKLWS